jgi:hypothetical protein
MCNGGLEQFQAAIIVFRRILYIGIKDISFQKQYSNRGIKQGRSIVSRLLPLYVFASPWRLITYFYLLLLHKADVLLTI